MGVGEVISKVLRILLMCLIAGSTLGWFPSLVNASSTAHLLDSSIDSSPSQTRATETSPVASQPVSSPAAGTWEVTGTIQLSGTERPLQIAISGGKAYVSRNPGHLSVVDLSTNTIVTTINFDPYPGSAPHYVGISGGKAYVALSNLGSDGQLAVINIANNTVSAYIPVGADPHGVATFGQKVYVTNNVWWSNGDPATVKVVDANSNAIIATIPVGINPTSIAVDPLSGKAYVTNRNDLSKSVSVIDTNTNSVTATIPINNPPAGVAISSSRAYISTTVNMPNGTVEVIDIGSDTVVSSIPVGRDSWGITASDAYVFVANQSSSTVSVLELATHSVVATVNVGDDPTGVAVDPSTNRVYVTNQGDNTISIIEFREAAPPANQPPAVSITSPSNNAAVSGTIVVQGTASDPDGSAQLQMVEVKIDTGTWVQASGTTSWSYTWDTTAVLNGQHSIYARSYDGQAYSGEESIVVSVNNVAPIPSLVDVGISSEAEAWPPQTFLQAKPGDRINTWYKISYPGSLIRVKLKTTILDPDDTEIDNPLNDPFLQISGPTEDTGWVGVTFEIPDEAILGTYDVKFSVWSEDGAQEYDFATKSGWLKLILPEEMEEPDIGPVSSIDFGNVTLGSSLDNTTTIYNEGNTTLTIHSITRTSGSSDFTYVGPSTPFSIGAGDSQAITIRFALGSEGTKSAVFNISSNDPDEADVTFNVSGSGIIERQLPTAYIDSVSPNPATQGKDTISFTGHGTDPDGSVVAYNWTSSLDGQLSTSSSFSKPASELSVGIHTIHFKVQDNDGLWSPEVMQALAIVPQECMVTIVNGPEADPATVDSNGSTRLSVSATDSLGHSISYSWTATGGSFDNANAQNPTWYAPGNTSSSMAYYTLSVTARCSQGKTANGNVQVGVRPEGVAPTVSTYDASDVGSTSATLTGYLESTGGLDCLVWFEYGETISYGRSTTKVSKSSVGSFSASLSDLAPGTTYHFRACASNSKGTSYGSDVMFMPPPEEVRVRIDSHSASPRDVKVGETSTLRFTFTNTGGTSWTFYAAVSLRRPDGTDVNLSLKAVSLNRYEQGSATWNYTIDQEGGWDIVFGIWKEQEQVNSLGHTGWLNDYIIARIPLEPQLPVANAGLDQLVYSGDLAYFDGSNSYDPDGTIVNYEWDFGDGETATGRQVSHRFRGATDQPRTYTVTLTVRDDEGLTDSDTARVTVIPIEKTVEVSHRPAVPIPDQPVFATIRVSYNWIHDDTYVVSKIDYEATGFAGVGVISIWDYHSHALPVPIWSADIPSFGGKEKTYYPRLSRILYGGDAFDGIAVDAFDVMNLYIAGWAGINISIGPSLLPPFFETNSACFEPDYIEAPDPPVEVPVLDLTHLCSAGELRVYDSQSRVTGLVNGQVKEEVPDSAYYDETILIFMPSDSYRYEVVGIDEGTYSLALARVTRQEVIVRTIAETEIEVKVIHRYTVDWDALSLGEEGVTMVVLTGGIPLWVWVTIAGLTGIVGFLVGAFIVRRRIVRKQVAKAQSR